MIVVYTTCATKKEAETIAQSLLKDKLIACANIWPAHSIYRWQNKIEKTGEWVLLCKTRQALYKKITKHIEELHSYALPVIEMWPVSGVSKDAAQWIVGATSRNPLS